MECVDAYIATGRSFYCLFYEERAPGDHLSRIYWFASDAQQTIRLICELEEWLVSIWANRHGSLWAASWDGRIFKLGATTEQIAATDLLGTIKLTGFGDEPDFLMGEDSHIFERRGQDWARIKFRGSCDVYSVAQRSSSAYWFVASDGRLIKYEGGTAEVERLPTNLDLHGIAFLNPNECLIAGDEGVLLQQSSGAWSDLTDDQISLPDVHAFKGSYLVTVEGERIDAVSLVGQRSVSLAKPGYYLSSNEQFCLTFYEEAALVFDSIGWSEIPFGNLVGPAT